MAVFKRGFRPASAAKRWCLAGLVAAICVACGVDPGGPASWSDEAARESSVRDAPANDGTGPSTVRRFGRFELVVDPGQGTATVRVDGAQASARLREIRQAAWCGADVVQDGVEGTGPVGTIELSTVPDSVASSRPGEAIPSACRVADLERERPEHDDLYEVDGLLCMTVTARQFIGESVDGLHAVITSIGSEDHRPWTWPYGTGADPSTLVGFGAPSAESEGVFSFGDVAAGAAATSMWTFRNGSDAPFVIRGELVHRVAEVCDNGIDDDCDGIIDNSCGLFEEGDACAADVDCVTARCADGACAPPHRCGDGIVGPGEICDDGDDDEALCTSECLPGDCALDPPGPTCDWVHDAPRDVATDFVHLFRPTNHRPTETWPTPSRMWRMRAGTWAADWNEAQARFTGFGRTERQGAWGTVEPDVDAVLEGLPSLTPTFEVDIDGERAVADAFFGTDRNGLHRSRIVEAGRYLNRLWTPTVEYSAAPELMGEIELVAMPRHVVLTHRVTAESALASGVAVDVRLTSPALTADVLAGATWSADDRSVRIESAGLLVVVYDQTGADTRLMVDGDSLVASRTFEAEIAADEAASVSVIIVPIEGAAEPFEALYLDPDAVAVDYTLLRRDGEPARAAARASWDETLGAIRVPLGTLQEAGAPGSMNWTIDDSHVWYGRHRLAIDSALPAEVSVPLVLASSNRISWNITGGVPIVRSLAGDALGWGMQTSKNWHERGAFWYRLVAHPTFVSDAPVEVEVTMASARWGRPWAASHAQLSLIGWSVAGGRWDESAIGCFGESVTFDPDQTLQRAMMDDVRPAFVRSENLWNWAGNVGGADFLQYRHADTPWWGRRLQGVRTTTRAPGPLRTDVMWEGVSSDGRIHGVIRNELAASDDLVRQWMHFEYTFLEDVAWDRLAFFQMAADNYADNGFAHVAWTDADGEVVVLDVPNHGTRGYASDAEQGIPLGGPTPWVSLYHNLRAGDLLRPGELPEEFADLGFAIRSYEARVGDAVITTPHINLNQTLNAGASQIGVEVGLPRTLGADGCGAPCDGRNRFAPAGSTVRFTIEYVVLPAVADRYYGVSDWITALDPAVFRTPLMMQQVATRGALTLEATRGDVVATYPPRLSAGQGPIAVDFTLHGGLGYVPVTVDGISRPDGWVVERWVDDAWAPEAVEVMGGDGRQAVWDDEAGTWSLTWSLPNRDTMRWRVRWDGP